MIKASRRSRNGRAGEPSLIDGGSGLPSALSIKFMLAVTNIVKISEGGISFDVHLPFNLLERGIKYWSGNAQCKQSFEVGPVQAPHEGSHGRQVLEAESL